MNVYKHGLTDWSCGVVVIPRDFDIPFPVTPVRIRAGPNFSSIHLMLYVPLIQVANSMCNEAELSAPFFRLVSPVRCFSHGRYTEIIKLERIFKVGISHYFVGIVSSTSVLLSQYHPCSGDSYSDVGYSPDESPPGEIEPLGVEYPGNTFADGANWVTLPEIAVCFCAYLPSIRQVGFLATEYNKSTLVVFDFAKGGETTKNLRYHLEEEFLPHIGDKPEYAPWSASNSLFGERSSYTHYLFFMWNSRTFFSHLDRHKRYGLVSLSVTF